MWDVITGSQLDFYDGPWSKISCSSDGQYVAVINNVAKGQLLVSSDYGNTFDIKYNISSDSNAPIERSWTEITVSSSGEYMIAAYTSGYIRISSDFGNSWTTYKTGTGLPLDYWSGISMSANGQTIIAVNTSGTTDSPNNRVFISRDNGNNWIQTATNFIFVWNACAMSGDGTCAVICANAVYLCTTINTTLTWNLLDQTIFASNGYIGASISYDGSVIAIIANNRVNNNSGIWVSTNGGSSWDRKYVGANTTNWTAINIDASGQFMTASSKNDGIYVSYDYGNTWKKTTASNSITTFRSVAMARDLSGNLRNMYACDDLVVYKTTMSKKETATINVGNNSITSNSASLDVSGNVGISGNIVISGNLNIGSTLIAPGQLKVTTSGIALGYQAGQIAPMQGYIAIGNSAGQYRQLNGIAIGNSAGQYTQGFACIALGNSSGQTQQHDYAIAIGGFAGANTQGTQSISIGGRAGYTNQSEYSIAIGSQAGYQNQGAKSIAIGGQAGYQNQGANSIAIGLQAGYQNQGANSIILNASTDGNFGGNNNSFYVSPIRDAGNSGPSASNQVRILQWDGDSKEITFNNNSGKSFIIDHPLDESKYLIHVCLEGPEAGVYYRGEGEILNNISSTIYLPDYVKKLATEFTVQLTPIYSGKKIEQLYCSRVKNNSFTVYGENTSFYWLVQGKRCDINVEPYKATTAVKGNGPYKWI